MDRRSLFGSLIAFIAGLPVFAKVAKTPQSKAEPVCLQGIRYVNIDRICKRLMQATFDVYRMPSTDTEKHPLVRLLEQPSQYDTFNTLLYRIGQQCLLTSTALVFMAPNTQGKPMELRCLPTERMIPHPAEEGYPDGYYWYEADNGSNWPLDAKIPAQWIMKIHGSSNPEPIAGTEAAESYLQVLCKDITVLMTKCLVPYFGDVYCTVVSLPNKG